LTSDDEGEYIPHWDSGCGGDRSHLLLKQADIDLVLAAAALNHRTIVVLQGGGALITHPWDEHVAAILMTWYPGMEGGHALSEILFGDFNPCGRLPLTIPRTMDQLPPFDKDAREVRYDYFHGYFLTDRDSAAVSYPFGYGLSYTTFTYSNIRIEKNVLSSTSELRVTVDVANSGTRDGEEVVQLYVGCVLSRVLRHKKDLRAFTKIALKAGESQKVVLKVPVAQLAFWDETAGGWEIEQTSYTAYVGSSSAECDLLSDSFRIE
jgi:beta-glucosidase